MTPEVLIERLLALVPRPRRHLVTYHGVLAPASGLRSRIVPNSMEEEGGDTEDEREEGAETEVLATETRAIDALRTRRRVPHAPGKRRRGGVRRHTWAELLRRVFAFEVLVCRHCGGMRRLLAAVTAPESIGQVLAGIGLAAEAPELAPARAPPGEVECWGA